jgi:hypothetical protein
MALAMGGITPILLKNSIDAAYWPLSESFLAGLTCLSYWNYYIGIPRFRPIIAAEDRVRSFSTKSAGGSGPQAKVRLKHVVA